MKCQHWFYIVILDIYFPAALPCGSIHRVAPKSSTSCNKSQHRQTQKTSSIWYRTCFQGTRKSDEPGWSSMEVCYTRQWWWNITKHWTTAGFITLLGPHGNHSFFMWLKSTHPLAHCGFSTKLSHGLAPENVGTMSRLQYVSGSSYCEMTSPGHTHTLQEKVSTISSKNAADVTHQAAGATDWKNWFVMSSAQTSRTFGRTRDSETVWLEWHGFSFKTTWNAERFFPHSCSENNTLKNVHRGHGPR